MEGDDKQVLVVCLGLTKEVRKKHLYFLEQKD